jgi:hypothetical protein
MLELQDFARWSLVETWLGSDYTSQVMVEVAGGRKGLKPERPDLQDQYIK